MVQAFLKKVIYGLGVMLGVVVLVFFLFQGLGDPTRLMIGQTGDQKTIEQMQKEWGLDKPLHQQFFHYLKDLSPIAVYSSSELESSNMSVIYSVGSEKRLVIKWPYLRSSYQSKQPVASLITSALLPTFLLAGLAMFFAITFGILLGCVAAIYKHTWIDRASIMVSVLGISAPSFFIGLVVAYLFGFVWNSWTGLSMTGSLYEIDAITGKTIHWKNIVRPLAIITQITRSSMLQVMEQDFIRTAYSKGLTTFQVVKKHALRNALNPVITSITGWFAELLAGAFFVEYIFGWQGLGKLTVDALEKLDFPVVMGCILLAAAIFVVVQWIADLLYAVVDPRIEIR
jgi:peptide/nickel transport system permease protein